MRTFKAMLSSFIIAAPVPVLANDMVTLRNDPFNEILRDAAQISGVIVAGVLRYGAAPTEGEKIALSADLPPNWSGNPICARVLSADGRYEATNEYNLSETWSGGVTQLPFPTRYADTLAGLPPQELAIQISSGDCRAQLQEAAVALWNPQEKPAAAQLLMNSFRADEVFMYLSDYPDVVRCNPLESGSMTAFDYVCSLPEDVSGEIEITLYRVSGGKPATPSVLNLWLGSGK